jgi:hypothetical protein
MSVFGYISVYEQKSSERITASCAQFCRSLAYGTEAASIAGTDQLSDSRVEQTAVLSCARVNTVTTRNQESAKRAATFSKSEVSARHDAAILVRFIVALEMSGG